VEAASLVAILASICGLCGAMVAGLFKVIRPLLSSVLETNGALRASMEHMTGRLDCLVEECHETNAHLVAHVKGVNGEVERYFHKVLRED